MKVICLLRHHKAPDSLWVDIGLSLLGKFPDQLFPGCSEAHVNSASLLLTPPSLKVKAWTLLCPVFCFLILVPQTEACIKNRHFLRPHFWKLDAKGMVSYCWVLTQCRGGRYHMVRQKPAAFSLSSLTYQFLHLTKIYLILHFCSFCIPSPFSFSLLFFSSLPPPSLSPSQSACECGPTWDTVHLWRSEHNFQEFNLSFHHGSLEINLKSSGLHSKSFSCWAVSLVCLPLLEKPWTPW